MAAARGFKTRCENISLQLRKELGIKKTSPLLAKHLADYMGVYLWQPNDIEGLSVESLSVLTKTGSNLWSGITLSIDEINAIIYNPTHSQKRLSNDIMHELSHLLLNHEPSKIMVSSDHPIILRSFNENLENEADWLSGCLLLPREALVYIKKQQLSIYQACEMYVVSKQLLQYRLNVTGVNRQFS